MKRLLLLTMFAAGLTVASHAETIFGIKGACVGSTTALSDSLFMGGTWSSSNPSVATIDASGIVTGVSAGTTLISYVIGATVDTTTVTISPVPAPITGAGSLCTGGSLTLADATAGGTWVCSATWIASIDASGIVTGGTYAGTADVLYYTGTGCFASTMVTVNATDAGYITEDSMVCIGSTITATASVPGGVWSISDPSVATIDASTGVVTGVGSGTAMISYTVTGACGTAYATGLVSVPTPGAAPTITGDTSVYVGSYVYLYSSTPGGTWASGSTAIATVTGGSVVGVSAGTTYITYTVSTCGATSSSTHIMHVLPVNRISGNIHFPSTGSPADTLYGAVKVWLITYNPGTLSLQAIDSVYASYAGPGDYTYTFNNPPTDSFRVKAAPASYFSVTGYIPTYHTSSYYWHDADVLYHTSPSSDAGVDINMITGTSSTGPGFIAGDVTTGANKGTSGTGAVRGLQMFAINTATGKLVQHTATDASGNYSFSNLPAGNYTIFPDSLNYATTPYTCSITSSAPSVSGASFIQHTVSHTITPAPTGVSSVTANAGITAFPNPTNGRLHIMWQMQAGEQGTATISDMAGRQVYTTGINMAKGAGNTQLDLSALPDGQYILNITSSSVNYNSKIQVAH